MILLTRGLPALLELGLVIFCMIDCVQTPESEVRNLPRWAWIPIILLVPIVGSVTWLWSGRPRSMARVGGRPRPVAPDDDPEFLRDLDLTAKRERLRRDLEAQSTSPRTDTPQPDDAPSPPEAPEPPEPGTPNSQA